MTTQQAIEDEISKARAGFPDWFGGKPCLAIPINMLLIDHERKAAYVTLEDLAKLFSN